MKTEINRKAASGWIFVLLEMILLGLAIGSFIRGGMTQQIIPYFIAGFVAIILFIFLMNGFFIVNPNESKVLTLFGVYKGSVKENGFYFANPFFTKKQVSLRAYNFQGEKIKVNDHVGNPIEIAAVVVWQVEDTYKTAFGVDNYQEFVKIQCESAMRTLAGKYPYDHYSDDHSEITLRSSHDAVNAELEKELSERLAIAGIKVVEGKISHLAYASEIAHAMLQRQQASAVVAARFKIVEGAVSMVEMALAQLSEKDIVHLDEEKKAAMVSNLLVVLCGDRAVSPVVNTGTIYQ